MALYDSQVSFAWKCKWEKQDTVTVFQDNLAKAYITLEHLDIYRSGIYFQVNEEFFESGAIAQVIEDNVDDVNCICSVRLQYRFSYLLWSESWQNLHLCWDRQCTHTVVLLLIFQSTASLYSTWKQMQKISGLEVVPTTETFVWSCMTSGRGTKPIKGPKTKCSQEVMLIELSTQPGTEINNERIWRFANSSLYLSFLSAMECAICFVYLFYNKKDKHLLCHFDVNRLQWSLSRSSVAWACRELVDGPEQPLCKGKQVWIRDTK